MKVEEIRSRIATPRFNLAQEPWIPIVKTEGTTDTVSLRKALLDSHRIRDVTGASTLEAWALRLFLIAITDDIVAPKCGALDQSQTPPEQLDPKLVEEYFNATESRLWLIHPTDPALQNADLVDRIAAGRSDINLHTVKTLCPHLPSSKHAAWWSHVPDQGFSLGLAAAARGLLVRTLFSSPGNEMGPQGQRHSIDSVFGAAGDGVGQLTILLDPGTTLLGLLLANLVEDSRPGGGLESADFSTCQLPARASMSRVEERLFSPTATLLIPADDVSHIAGIMRAPRFASQFSDDAKARVKDVRARSPHLFAKTDSKGETKFIWADPTKAAWRELPAIQESMSRPLGPSVLSPLDRAFDVVAPARTLGVVFRGKAAQAIIDGWYESSLGAAYFGDQEITYFVAALLNPDKQCPGFVEDVARHLAQHLRIVFAPDHDQSTGKLKKFSRPTKSGVVQVQGALAQYWKTSERLVAELVSNSETDFSESAKLPRQWSEQVVNVAREISDEVIDTAISADPGRILDLEQIRSWSRTAFNRLLDRDDVAPSPLPREVSAK